MININIIKLAFFAKDKACNNEQYYTKMNRLADLSVEQYLEIPESL